MSVTSIKFRNFKVFRDATLPLGRTTLLVGPNGSGKTTALQAIRLLATPVSQLSNLPADVDSKRSVGVSASEDVSLQIQWDTGQTSGLTWRGPPIQPHRVTQTGDAQKLATLASTRAYTLLTMIVSPRIRIGPRAAN